MFLHVMICFAVSWFSFSLGLIVGMVIRDYYRGITVRESLNIDSIGWLTWVIMFVFMPVLYPIAYAHKKTAKEKQERKQ